MTFLFSSSLSFLQNLNQEDLQNFNKRLPYHLPCPPPKSCDEHLRNSWALVAAGLSTKLIRSDQLGWDGRSCYFLHTVSCTDSVLYTYIQYIRVLDQMQNISYLYIRILSDINMYDISNIVRYDIFMHLVSKTSPLKPSISPTVT